MEPEKGKKRIFEGEGEVEEEEWIKTKKAKVEAEKNLLELESLINANQLDVIFLILEKLLWSDIIAMCQVSEVIRNFCSANVARWNNLFQKDLEILIKMERVKDVNIFHKLFEEFKIRKFLLSKKTKEQVGFGEEVSKLEILWHSPNFIFWTRYLFLTPTISDTYPLLRVLDNFMYPKSIKERMTVPEFALPSSHITVHRYNWIVLNGWENGIVETGAIIQEVDEPVTEWGSYLLNSDTWDDHQKKALQENKFNRNITPLLQRWSYPSKIRERNFKLGEHYLGLQLAGNVPLFFNEDGSDTFIYKQLDELSFNQLVIERMDIWIEELRRVESFPFSPFPDPIFKLHFTITDLPTIHTEDSGEFKSTIDNFPGIIQKIVEEDVLKIKENVRLILLQKYQDRYGFWKSHHQIFDTKWGKFSKLERRQNPAVVFLIKDKSKNVGFPELILEVTMKTEKILFTVMIIVNLRSFKTDMEFSKIPHTLPNIYIRKQFFVYNIRHPYAEIPNLISPYGGMLVTTTTKESKEQPMDIRSLTLNE